MKTLYNKIKLIAGIFILAIVAVSCLPETQTMGEAGQTLLKLYPDEFKLVPLDAKSTSQTAALLEVRRDIPSKTVLENTETTFVLAYDVSGTQLAAYNTANETNYIPLPTNLFTMTPAITAGKVTLTIPKGEFAASIMITVPNANNFDFSKKYALAFKIESISGEGELSAVASDEIIVNVLVKNKYDGKYKATGYFTHPTSPRAIDMDKNMGTSGGASISGGYADLGGAGYTYNITVDEASNLSVPGVAQRCYRVTMANTPVAFIYYDVTPEGIMKNYCYEHKPGKWTFVLFSGYSNGTRKSEETLVMY